MNELQIETFPLHGTRLIEASAGTGKTYTIAALYLRLLLEQQLDVTQILVVTFTEAATQELRGRIRQRIRDALLWLESDRNQDDDLTDLLRPYKDRPEVHQHLRDAITRMDEASVYTIHGFCQRCLSDSAFESGVLFDVEFITDQAPIRQQAIEDFWRAQVTATDQANSEWVLTRWRTPSALIAEISKLIDNPEIRIIPDPAQLKLEELQQAVDTLYRQFRRDWRQSRDETHTLLAQSPLLGRAAQTYRQDLVDSLYAAIDETVEQEAKLASLPPGFGLLTSSRISDPASQLKKEIKKGTQPPEHPLFDLAEALMQAFDKWSLARTVKFLYEAAIYVRQAVEKRKTASREMFFDDLLSKLDKALNADGGAALAAGIRRQYQVAMIDEFQDTDPQQYRIFKNIFHSGAPGSLFMIGDPKQAIYSFRGADIFTYMQARSDTDAGSAHFTLDTNYRSHSSLVRAVNRIFRNAAAPFIYHRDIVFEPVNAAGARGKADQHPLRLDGKIPSPLLCWYVAKTEGNSSRGSISKKWAGQRVARGTAAEISRLLLLGQRGKATIGERPLVARDIAVLVRDRFEAASIRNALTELGIASVYLSRDSVFSSEEAVELAHLLRAVAEPSNAIRLRTAMATRLIGLTAREIHELNLDENVWDFKVQTFVEYHRLWNQQGFMPMFHKLMRQQGVITRLLSSNGGERRLTNLLHLVELAQTANMNHPGIENLLRWLDDQRTNPNGNSEEQQLRLESDEDLVQIVTIHKSKGLEYPIVFLPFIWASRKNDDKGVVTYHDSNRALVADLGSAQREQGLQLAAKERLAEDLRLLYVALTRARYRCYFSWGQFFGAANSALGYLLHQQRDEANGEIICNLAGLDDAAIQQDLQALGNEDEAGLEIEELPQQGVMYSPDRAADLPAKALAFNGDIRQQWSITSFSALSHGQTRHADYRVELPDHDQAMSVRGEIDSATEQTRFSFPRGAKAGLLLHQIFETIDFPDAAGDSLEQVIAKTLDQYGIDQNWGKVTGDWIGAVLDTSLNPQTGLNLRRIPKSKRLVELEFSFPLKQFSAQGLNPILGSMMLDFPTLSGLMKGFIDLIFEHDGRFYVLDYKSNHLGNSFEDYRPDRLQQAIEANHYDLQYLIYVLALHRYLDKRLPDYDYATHFGGVYYLFLRGMKPENGPATGVYFDRPEFELIDALDRLCRAGELKADA